MRLLLRNTDGQIRQVYQIVYQVISDKYSIASQGIVVSSKQFTLLIWEQNNKIKSLGLRDYSLYLIATEKVTYFGCRNVCSG